MQEERVAAEQRKQAEAAHRRRLGEMEDLARRENALWQEIEDLIESYQPQAYSKATSHLVNLRDLAEHRGTQAAFREQMDRLVERYRRRPSLMARFQNKGLM